MTNLKYECALFSHTPTLIPLSEKLKILKFKNQTKKVHIRTYNCLKQVFLHDLQENVLKERIGPIQDRNRLITAYNIKTSQIISGNIDTFLKEMQFECIKEIKTEINQFKRGNITIDAFFEDKSNEWFCHAYVFSNDLLVGEEILLKLKNELEDVIKMIKV